MHKEQIKTIVLPIITFFILIGSWELIDLILKIREVVLPNPHEILFAVINNFGELLFHTSITMIESVLGFVIGVTVSILIAILFTYSLDSKVALYPYAIALKATPLYALAPLLVLWFGNGIWAKVVMSAMVAFFPVLVNSVKGFSTIDREILDLFNSMKASKVKTFIKLRVPNALPIIFPALKIATTLSVVGATIAEFTGSSYGAGYLIVNASYYLETSLMFASILMISIGGILFFYLIDRIEKKVVFWQKKEWSFSN